MADDEHAPLPVIRNVVATVDVGCAIDLEQLFQSGYQHMEYTDKAFAKAVTLRLPGASTNGRVFQTGKMMILGANSDEGASLAAQTFTQIIQERGFPGATFGHVKVVNIIAKWNLSFGIRLAQLKEELGNEQCKYDEQRPQVMYYKMEDPKITLNIFENGTINLLGATSDQDVFDACESIYPVLWQYRKHE